MTDSRNSPTDTVAQGNCAKRETPTQGCVGQLRHSHCEQQGWLVEQHQRDLEVLDRIERQMEEAGDVTARSVQP